MNKKTVMLVGCAVCAALTAGIAAIPKKDNAVPPVPVMQKNNADHETESPAAAHDFSFDADPETGQLHIIRNGARISASLPMPKEPIAHLAKTTNSVAWTYPRKQMNVKMEKKGRYLEVSLTSTGAAQFEWPRVQGDSYTLPIGEGKYIPGGDPTWKSFLKDNDMSFIESFSMRFFCRQPRTGFDCVHCGRHV